MKVRLIFEQINSPNDLLQFRKEIELSFMPYPDLVLLDSEKFEMKVSGVIHRMEDEFTFCYIRPLDADLNGKLTRGGLINYFKSRGWSVHEWKIKTNLNDGVS